MSSAIIDAFLLTCMGVIAIMMLICLYRAVRGPRFTDRIVMVNAISTQIIVFIALLAVYFHENYLLDVAMVYAMLGFISVAVICRIAAFRVYGKKIHEPELLSEEDHNDFESDTFSD